ncbi:hypothetical protein FACS189430_07910 [Bacteroidia bacterium]|nr:hypothetical protein FACS189430_07910 [Bacteroidia bacterium]
MAKYLDPKNDLVFKRVFGEHPHLLISFLNALLPLEKDRVVESVEYLPHEQADIQIDSRRTIVDVKCKDSHGRQFIVEMQMYWSSVFNSRMVFNASRAFARQLKKGDNYTQLKPVYGIAILNDYMQPKDENSNFYHHYKTVNIENTNDVIHGLEFVLVELPKFKPEKIADRKMAILWLRFLKEVGEENFKVDKEMAGNEEINEAIEICAEGGFTEDELETYETYWDKIRTEIAVNIASFEEGKAKGKAEGLNEGVNIGKWEQAVKVILKGNKAGMSVDALAALTDLSPEQVTAILKEQGLLNS